MTNRPTNHDRKAEAKKPATPDFSKYKVCNSTNNDNRSLFYKE